MFDKTSNRTGFTTALIASALISSAASFAQVAASSDKYGQNSSFSGTSRVVKGGYDGTAVVSPVPGDPAASGQALRKTLASLSPAPSAGFRWLVRIEAGVYELGSETLAMRPYADLEGAGEAATILTGNVGPEAGAAAREAQNDQAAAGLDQGVLAGASNAEIRQLTLECVPSVAQPACLAMINDNASPRVTQVRLRVVGASDGSHWGMRNYDAAPALEQVEIEVSGARNGDNYGLVNVGQSFQTVIDLRHSTVAVAGAEATNNWAILNRGQAKVHPLLSSTITATGGQHAAGLVYADAGFSGDFYLQDSTVTASGGAVDSIALSQEASGDSSVRPIVRFSNLSGDTHGILMSFNNAVVVEDSELYGSQFAVAAGSVTLTRTYIRGGEVFGASSETCTDIEGPDHTPYPDTCP